MSMRNIYRKIAKENGVSVKEVKEEMQKAIDYAYKNSPINGVTNVYQSQVKSKGDVPTTDEFIMHTVKKIETKK